MKAALAKLIALMVLAASVDAVLPSAANACSCAQLPREQAFATATDVFEGRVLSIRIDASDHSTVVELNVVRTWKGARSERATIVTAQNSSICGYPFQENTSYLVYATTADGVMRTQLCTRTNPMSSADAMADVRAMGAGVTPVDVPRDAQRRTSGRRANH